MLTRTRQFIAIPLYLHLTALLLLSAPQKSNVDRILDSLFAVALVSPSGPV